MRTLPINDFQTNLTSIPTWLKNNDYLLLTSQDKAIGLISAFNDELFKQGFVQWIGIKAFSNGDLTLRQLAALLRSDVDSTLKLLHTLNIPIIDYDFNEDLEICKQL